LKKLVGISYFVLLTSYFISSCTTIDLYEKTVPVPGHAWQNSFRPSFDFTIKDTTVRYLPFLVLRHTDKYNYSNIYINLYVKGPGQDTAQKYQMNPELANNEGGWKATGMDDIYEHRIELDKPKYLKAGKYTFTVEQIMRENPLQNVLDVGIRIEKEK